MIAKDMTPKSIGQFFYQKYEKIIKEYQSDSETEMSPKSEHHWAGTSIQNSMKICAKKWAKKLEMQCSQINSHQKLKK
jgi:hypothetical protein